MNQSNSNQNKQEMEKYFFRASAEDFKKIPGSPIAYWISAEMLNSFKNGKLLRDITIPRQGLATMDNSRFTRQWFEVSSCTLSFMTDKKVSKWYPYNKGGDYRKWYGNQELVVNWLNSGSEIKKLAIDRYGSASKRVVNEDSYFKESITWSKIGSSYPSFRLQPKGAIFDVAGMSMFPEKQDSSLLLCLLNTQITIRILAMLSPTLNFEAGQIGMIPVIAPLKNMSDISNEAVRLQKFDWDFYETSWEFKSAPLFKEEKYFLNIAYKKLRSDCKEIIVKMQKIEEENNKIFIEAYGLQNELTAEVPLNEITLTFNPHYRYGKDKSEEELEALLLADTMRELVSYAVGCMFGRYSLDKPGLILANQGETIEDYRKQIPNSSFPADDDNVIPILNGDWFTDDVTERFREFLRVTFGAEYYEENLKFIEQALNVKGKRNYSIRDYFISEFYPDHIKRYKKRPIYWLFTSSEGSFNALIYMHRYRPDTVSVILNNYLREFRTKVNARKDHLAAVSISANAGAAEKAKATKEVEQMKKIIVELEEYEREILYPLATNKIEIDLDDGVKVNYLKFGDALKKIPGLETKEE